jgi:hypothetical protein
MKKTVFALGLVLVLLAALPAAAGEKGSWKGWIADEKCAGARDDHGASADHAGCAANCIKGGQKAVFVSHDGTVYQVKNQDAVTSHAGHHVEVSGTVHKDKTLTVDKVKML